MKRMYEVEIEEFLVRRVVVEAEDNESAVKLVEFQYDNSEIVLGSGDYVGKEIHIINE